MRVGARKMKAISVKSMAGVNWRCGEVVGQVYGATSYCNNPAGLHEVVGGEHRYLCWDCVRRREYAKEVRAEVTSKGKKVKVK